MTAHGWTSNDRLSAICIAGWIAGAAFARFAGTWVGIGGAALALGALVIVRSISQSPQETSSWLMPTRGACLSGAIAAAAMLAATYTLYPLAVQLYPPLEDAVRELYRLFGNLSPVGTVILLAVVFSEEIVWRGRVQQSIECRVPPGAAIGITGLAYAAAHLAVGHPLLAGIALPCGLFWSWLRVRTGSLVPGLMCHAVWDLFILVLFPLSG